ncbi:STAS domain-containing protein [Actinomadura geliboluensis]|uniref:STAS domain-containing protein n=1 Tax=Actinomadura geliboluensis TaxID=882440 RepID=A0A5S4HED7_9ACTN|nr:STAS domain-containing protein [Actinomadura geliboluensis]
MLERLYATLRDSGAYVIISLSDVTFCDASGLAMLAGAHHQAAATGTILTHARPRPQPADLLRATRLHRVFISASSATGAQNTSPDIRSTAA